MYFQHNLLYHKLIYLDWCPYLACFSHSVSDNVFSALLQLTSMKISDLMLYLISEGRLFLFYHSYKGISTINQKAEEKKKFESFTRPFIIR